jgi:N-acetylmuramoyl-L-alanine amidase
VFLMSFSSRLALIAIAITCGMVAAPVNAQDDSDTPPTRLDAIMQTVTAEQPARASYASLADAVAAQSLDDLDDESRCMAGAIYFESKGEPLTGQLAVADVILNRIRSGRFAGTICSVVTQRGQFSFVRDGRVPDIADCAHYRTAIAVARVAMADAWESPASDALFFHARRISPGWHREQIATIGNQVFYR